MASKRRIRRKACGNKVQHDTARDAENAKFDLIRRLKSEGKRTSQLSVYHCPVGNHWHLGHSPKRVRQSIAARQKNKRENR